MKDTRRPYVRELEESPRPRRHWRGINPEQSGEWADAEYLFETVEDDDAQRIAIRQIVIRRSGAVNRYWWKHLEDRDGFLTDQPLGETAKLEPITGDEFDRLWRE